MYYVRHSHTVFTVITPQIFQVIRIYLRCKQDFNWDKLKKNNKEFEMFSFLRKRNSEQDYNTRKQ